ncbi:MAG: hypothetical protein ACE37F_09705 [Nannocystaceae bacterium]|nr:hypothetical protein [bacterium]
MTRFAPVLAVALVGCSVPTSVGELQSAAVEPTDAGSTTAPADASSTSDANATSTTLPEDDTSSSSESTGSELVPQMGGFAIRWGDIPEGGDTDTSNSSVGSGSEWDPDALLVQVGVSVASCDDVSPIEPCSTWQASFTLEPDQQVAGTYDGSEINATFSEIGPGPNPDRCGGFGGGTLETTVVIESIDDGGVQLRFENVQTSILDVELEGFETFVPRC